MAEGGEHRADLLPVGAAMVEGLDHRDDDGALVGALVEEHQVSRVERVGKVLLPQRSGLVGARLEHVEIVDVDRLFGDFAGPRWAFDLASGR